MTENTDHTMRLMVQEGQLLAVFNSSHRIMKAEALLKGSGHEVLLLPAPRQLQTDCGLALRFDAGLLPGIMAALDRAELLPAFVCRMEQGVYTTVWGERT